ncbi:hypothetical protein IGI56_003652, partial [Enterococcus sp. AZ192]
MERRRPKNTNYAEVVDKNMTPVIYKPRET